VKGVDGKLTSARKNLEEKIGPRLLLIIRDWLLKSRSRTFLAFFHKFRSRKEESEIKNCLSTLKIDKLSFVHLKDILQPYTSKKNQLIENWNINKQCVNDNCVCASTIYICVIVSGEINH
jgi:hypothetical protein